MEFSTGLGGLTANRPGFQSLVVEGGGEPGAAHLAGRARRRRFVALPWSVGLRFRATMSGSGVLLGCEVVYRGTMLIALGFRAEFLALSWRSPAEEDVCKRTVPLLRSWVRFVLGRCGVGWLESSAF